LSIKEKETRLILPEHDDDDDDVRVQRQIQTLSGFMMVLNWNNSLPALSMGHEY
jgi:hypothetical protein